MAEDGAPKKTGGGVISAVFAAIGVGVAFIGAHVIPEIVSHLSSVRGMAWPEFVPANCYPFPDLLGR